MLTVGICSGPNHQCISNQSVPAFVQSYSQSQARLMFVTTLGMDNFDCTKMNAHFKKFTACLREGLIHEWKQALLAPPLPLMLLNNSRLCSTHNHSSAFLSVQGVVTYMSPVEAFATAIKFFDRQKVCLIA